MADIISVLNVEPGSDEAHHPIERIEDQLGAARPKDLVEFALQGHFVGVLVPLAVVDDFRLHKLLATEERLFALVGFF